MARKCGGWGKEKAQLRTVGLLDWWWSISLLMTTLPWSCTKHRKTCCQVGGEGIRNEIRTLPRWFDTDSLPNAYESCLLHRHSEVTIADCFIDGLIVCRCRLVKAVIDVARRQHFSPPMRGSTLCLATVHVNHHRQLKLPWACFGHLYPL